MPGDDPDPGRLFHVGIMRPESKITVTHRVQKSSSSGHHGGRVVRPLITRESTLTGYVAGQVITSTDG